MFFQCYECFQDQQADQSNSTSGRFWEPSTWSWISCSWWSIEFCIGSWLSRTGRAYLPSICSGTLRRWEPEPTQKASKTRRATSRRTFTNFGGSKDATPLLGSKWMGWSLTTFRGSPVVKTTSFNYCINKALQYINHQPISRFGMLE